MFSGSRSQHCCPITLMVEGIKVDAVSSEGQAFLFCPPRLPSPAHPPVRAGGQRGRACCLRGGTGLVEAEIISPVRLWILFASPEFECTTGPLATGTKENSSQRKDGAPPGCGPGAKGLGPARRAWPCPVPLLLDRRLDGPPAPRARWVRRQR